MPIFSIHGNHDHPVGLELFSSMDQLSCNSYINYFGKVHSVEEIVVEPVLLVKGKTKLALYGIGHIKDHRLNLAFESNKVEFKRPKTSDGEDDPSWFNILVLHQNRWKGQPWQTRDAVTDHTLPDFIDLVVWGHEHESMPYLREC